MLFGYLPAIIFNLNCLANLCRIRFRFFLPVLFKKQPIVPALNVLAEKEQWYKLAG